MMIAFGNLASEPFSKQAVPFHRFKPAVPDDSLDFPAGQSLLRFGARHVPDFFLDHGAVKIVGAELFRRL